MPPLTPSGFLKRARLPLLWMIVGSQVFLIIAIFSTANYLLAKEAKNPSDSPGALLALSNVESIERQTKGPARFSDASLIKTLEELGIGRPSTYAPTLSTIEERGYVVRDDEKRLSPTEVGEKVNDLLVEHFAAIVDVDFTRKMEEELDLIAVGQTVIAKQAQLKRIFHPPRQRPRCASRAEAFRPFP